MTLHSAKGLEFPQVYLAGMEDGLFPSYMSIVADDAAAELEEERRLAYVGITRAKQNLAITCAKQRMVRGETQYNKVSRFVKEIPRELLSGAVRKEKEHKEPKAARISRQSRSSGQNHTVCRKNRKNPLEHRAIRHRSAIRKETASDT